MATSGHNPADPEQPTVTIASVASVGAPILPGQTLSHYRIVAKIGEGGMGAVYKATDTVLGRPVALKVISREVVSAGDKLRFAREAKAASALNHPNIVTIYEYASENGIDFIAMEFVEGEPLSRVLKHGNSPLAALLEYARQVAVAVAKAHAAGITHRDLKPGNIMITPDGLAKVLDFGLAKHAPGHAGGEEPTDSVRLTRAGAAMGTPAYMSPEQAMGEAADFRSDIFSFGIILYELACDRRPFRGEDEQNTLRQILFKEPPPMDTVEPSLPAALQSLILACLKKDKTERPQSMAEVAKGLQLLTGSTSGEIQATPPSRNHYGWLAWPAAAAVLAAAGWFAWPKILASPVFQASILAPDSYQQYQKAVTLLKKKYRKQFLDEAIGLLEQAIAANPNHAASYAALTEAYVARNQTASDQQWVRLAASTAAKAASLDPNLAAAQVAVGSAAVMQQNYGPAEKALRRALELDARSSSAHLWLGHLADRRKISGQAEAEFGSAIALGPEDWEAPLALGRLLYGQQHYAAAATTWEKTPANGLDNPILHSNLGAAYSKLNRIDDAAAAMQRALQIEPSASAYSNLGTLQYYRGYYSEAVKAFEKAVEMNANRYLYWGNLGDAYRWSPGERPKAVAAYRHAIELAQQQVGKIPDAPSQVAGYMAKSGDTTGALRVLAALPVQDYLAATHFRAAIIHELAGQRDAALTSLQAALTRGYPSGDINNDPELLNLRSDARYHRLTIPSKSSGK